MPLAVAASGVLVVDDDLGLTSSGGIFEPYNGIRTMARGIMRLQRNKKAEQKKEKRIRIGV